MPADAISGASLGALACEVLLCADAGEKARLSRAHAARWQAARAAGAPPPLAGPAPPDRPARPEAPALLAPRQMPRRRPGSPAGRVALLHAVAHIELNAIDLHWDMVARFAGAPVPLGFFDDWVRAADDEARHFGLLCECLEEAGSHYGALPAHAGMWQAAETTAHDLLARLAVVPMVMEARGLDVTPAMIAAFEAAGEARAVRALRVIHEDEVAHVAYGAKWFHFLCGRSGTDPQEAFHTLVRRYFHGPLKPPFDQARRGAAGLPPDYYWPLAEPAD